jgi:hypothetical protein
MSNVTHESILRAEANYWRIEANHSYAQWERAMEDLEKYRWRPIETAPKDGTWILVYKPFNLYGFDDSEWYVDKYIVRWADECWNISMEDKVAYPTHWMPMPKPPAR